MKKEIRICGFGGQGIVLAGVILGETAAKAGYQVVQTQSYGPESRGGAARSEILISDQPIDYPRVSRADLLIALSQTAYEKYGGDLSKEGIAIVDQDLVQIAETRRVPFTGTAEQVGHKIVANIVMLGYIGALLGLFDESLLEETVLRNIPKGTEEMNRKALLAGRQLFGQGE